MKTTRSKQSKARRQIAAPADDTPVYPVVGTPIYYNYKKKKSKRGSSRASRRFIDIEKRVTRAVNRVTRAVDKGVDNYVEKRDKSARKRRDGALVDFYENASVGTARALSESSPVLTDIAKAVNTKRLRKRIKRAVRIIPVLW